MKPTIYYAAQDMQMGDLLLSYHVHLDRADRALLQEALRDYLIDGRMWGKPFTADLGTIRLVLDGPDEVRHLYNYIVKKVIYYEIFDAISSF